NDRENLRSGIVALSFSRPWYRGKDRVTGKTNGQVPATTDASFISCTSNPRPFPLLYKRGAWRLPRYGTERRMRQSTSQDLPARNGTIHYTGTGRTGVADKLTTERHPPTPAGCRATSRGGGSPPPAPHPPLHDRPTGIGMAYITQAKPGAAPPFDRRYRAKSKSHERPTQGRERGGGSRPRRWGEMAAERDVDDLPRNAANYTALTPLWFLERAALAHPARASLVHGALRYTWADTY
uniref:Uncharacterized protein n=1 Tax=Aegilops tauschii subsp. strangulata TaxID=200361 RepID=A0A453I8W5_AEGTS